MTAITWFIWCQIFHPQAGIRMDQPWHTQPGPGRPLPAKVGPGCKIVAEKQNGAESDYLRGYFEMRRAATAAAISGAS